MENLIDLTLQLTRKVPEEEPKKKEADDFREQVKDVLIHDSRTTKTPEGEGEISERELEHKLDNY